MAAQKRKRDPRDDQLRRQHRRNYAATESTLINNRKTRRDIAALWQAVIALQRKTSRLL